MFYIQQEGADEINQENMAVFLSTYRDNKWAASSEKVHSNIQIILRMRKVSSGPLLAIYVFCNIQWLFADSEGPDQTAHLCSLIWAFMPAHDQKAQFRMVGLR